MPHTLEFLVSPEAARLRMEQRRPAFVVHLEFEGGGYQEMDADDQEAAYNLAQTIIETWGSVLSVSVRRVQHDGTLGEGGRLYMKKTGHTNFARPRPGTIGTYHRMRQDGTIDPVFVKRFRIKSVGAHIAIAQYTKEGGSPDIFEVEASSFIWLFSDGPNKCHVWPGHPLHRHKRGED